MHILILWLHHHILSIQDFHSPFNPRKVILKTDTSQKEQVILLSWWSCIIIHITLSMHAYPDYRCNKGLNNFFSTQWRNNQSNFHHICTVLQKIASHIAFCFFSGQLDNAFIHSVLTSATLTAQKYTSKVIPLASNEWLL